VLYVPPEFCDEFLELIIEELFALLIVLLSPLIIVTFSVDVEPTVLLNPFNI
jgi:hypothetical protein